MNNLLTADHLELDDILGQLFLAIEKSVKTKVFEKLDLFWARLATHIRAEHLHLFPAILKAVEIHEKSNKGLSLKSVQITLSGLCADHDFFVRELAAGVKLAREIVVQDQDTAEKLSMIRKNVAGVHARLDRHNKLEESQVYRWADELISKSDRTGLAKLVQRELDYLPPRFARDRTGRQKRNYD